MKLNRQIKQRFKLTLSFIMFASILSCLAYGIWLEIKWSNEDLEKEKEYLHRNFSR